MVLATTRAGLYMCVTARGMRRMWGYRRYVIYCINIARHKLLFIMVAKPQMHHCCTPCGFSEDFRGVQVLVKQVTMVMAFAHSICNRYAETVESK